MRSASQRTGQPMRAIAEALLATLSGEQVIPAAILIAGWC